MEEKKQKLIKTNQTLTVVLVFIVFINIYLCITAIKINRQIIHYVGECSDGPC